MTNDPIASPNFDADVVSVQTRTTQKPARLLSLDVLRGLTIGFMILVNNQTGAGAFGPLRHAQWNGFTPTDLVFPTFLLLVGLSTVLSTEARIARGVPRATIFLHTLQRSGLLFLLGLVVNNFPFFHLHTARIYGVLPRIAVCYLMVASLYLAVRTMRSRALILAAIAAFCLVLYWVLMRFVPVPGFGVPTHEIPINDPDGNLTAFLDRHVFAASHLYEKTRDPEGLLSTIPSVATALFGILAGIWLRTSRSIAQKAKGIEYAGIAFLLLGGAWHFTFPINKKLWTSSFSLWAGGWSLLLLALSIYLIDVLRVGRKKNGDDHPAIYKPFLVFGTNAIAAYTVSELMDSLLSAIHTASGSNVKQPYIAALTHTFANSGIASLLYSLSFVAVCWLIVYSLYRKRIFLKI